MLKEVILTPEGYEKLKQEIEVLSTAKRREVADRIRVAREFGDISENAEYDDAKNEQAMLEHKIAQLEERLLNARVIEKRDVDLSVVSVGAKVKLRDVDAKSTVEYTIVGSAEANPAESKLSNESPVGKAIIGKKKGEIVAVREVAGQLEPGATDESRRFRLAGRVLGRREMGQITFLDLVDRSGRIQLLAGKVDVALGDIVGVTGHPAKSRRGEPSLQVVELELLGKIRAPLPDTFHGLTDTEARYRKRYLDLLMNEETRSDFLVRTRIVTAIRRYLDGEGFVEVETPVLQPRYGGAFARPFVTRYNELEADFYLRIATELYLKRLIVGGLERVYEIGKDFRNEGVSYKHSPEFTMLEWYEAYADYRDTMERMERLIETVALEVNGTTTTSFRGHELDLKAPWRRLSFTEALAEHGLWIRAEAELRAALNERGVETGADKDW